MKSKVIIIKYKKWAAYFGMVFILTITGCGKDNAKVPGNADLTNNIEDTVNEANAMGRYMEEAIDISDQVCYGCRLHQLENGSLVITDSENDFVYSADGGVTWEADIRDWRTDMIEKDTYILDYAVGADNTVAVLYDASDEEAEEETDSAFDIKPKLLIINPDGTQIIADTSSLEEGDDICKVWISDKGRIFATTYETTVYEIKENGSSETFLTLDRSYYMPTLIQFQENLMIIDGVNYDGLLIYDMEKEKYIEDEVLNDFVNTNYHGRTAGGGSYYDMYFFPGEEGVLYLAGEKGLHRHVIGGSAMEQVIDGNLTVFGNPAYTMCGMTILDNSEFLALFNGGRLVRFTYDPDIPTVPNEKLKVYSLRDNNTIRQTINLYQSVHPEYYIEYEIGIEDGASITRDDALKNLNTRIMAGEGPDILIMDNMPIDAYLEKGILLELTPFLESLDEEDALFENIVDAFRIEENIYMLPCEIQLPLMFGEEHYISQITDLSDIAEALEMLRQDNPEKDLIGVCSEKGIMRLFSMVSGPYWKIGNNGIDKEALTDYYVQIKRIYDAQMEGLPEDVIKEAAELNDFYMGLYGFDPEDSSSFIRGGIDYVAYATGMREVACGTLMSSYEYMGMQSVKQMEDCENAEIIMMNEDIFYPQTLVGINASSGNVEAAENFLRLLLGKENQSSLFKGLPVNKAVFHDDVHGSEYDLHDDDALGFISIGAEAENAVTIKLKWPEEEQIQVLQDWMESVNTPCIDDDVLENAVYEEGLAYLQGDQSVEEAVEAVEKTVSLYMAE